MTEKTLPEQARSLAKFVEENNYNEWPEDWEISLLLNELAGEIERLQDDPAEHNAADLEKIYRLKAALSSLSKEHAKEHEDSVIQFREMEKLANYHAADKSLLAEELNEALICIQSLEGECDRARAERDELLKLLDQIKEWDVGTQHKRDGQLLIFALPLGIRQQSLNGRWRARAKFSP